MKCQCEICVFSNEVARVQEKLSPEDRAVIEALLNKWESESMDASYYQCVINGKWPNSKTIAAAQSSCPHEWPGPGDMPAKWNCVCGTLIYRSYKDYCWD